MTATRFGTFDGLMADTDQALRPVARRLRGIVFEVHPDAVEVVRLGDRAATYGLGPRKMIEGYCYVLPHQRWVNLGFLQGVRLPDPTGLLEGTGASLRHVRIRSLEAAEAPAVRALIEAAVAERRALFGR